MIPREHFQADHAQLVADLERPTAAVETDGDMRALRLMHGLMRSFIDRWPDLPANSREGRPQDRFRRSRSTPQCWSRSSRS